MTDPVRPPLPDPYAYFGFRPGDEGQIIGWRPLRAFLDLVADSSDRFSRFEIGHDWSGRAIPAYVVTSPETQSRLQDYQLTAAGGRLTNDRLVAVVTASIHATEIGGSQMMPLFFHELAISNDPRTRSIVESAITIIVPCANPGGLELVREWYESTAGTPHTGSLPPFPDHPVGHDINRDWVLLSQPETRAIHGSIFRKWRPHLHIDLHQMRTQGPRFALPPFIDPHDPNVDPDLLTWSGEIGERVAGHLRANEYRGVVTGTFFDAFSPARGYVTYHCGLRILAEAASARLASSADVPRITRSHPDTRSLITSLTERKYGWSGGLWRLRDAVDLHREATLAALATAVEIGVRQPSVPRDASTGGWLILPFALQRDPDAARRMLQVLLDGEIEIRHLHKSFRIDGVELPGGGFFVPADQPFAGYAATLLDVAYYPGEELSSSEHTHIPYDVTAHSLPLAMGVDLLRLSQNPPADEERLESAPAPVGWIQGRHEQERFVISPRSNAAARVVNWVLAYGGNVSIAEEGEGFETGSFVVSGIDRVALEREIRDTGLRLVSLSSATCIELTRQPFPKIGLYRAWGGEAEDAGWTEYVLRDHGFTCRNFDPEAVRLGTFADLDCMILPSQPGYDILFGPTESDLPEGYRGGMGRAGIEHLRGYVHRGGTLIALGSAADAALAIIPSSLFNCVAALPPDQFQTPGPMIALDLDKSHPVAWGLESPVTVTMANTPIFASALADDPNVSVVASVRTDEPVQAGWMRGIDRISGRAAIVEIRYGSGRAILFGCRPQFRGTSLGAFRLLFNAIYLSARERPRDISR